MTPVLAFVDPADLVEAVRSQLAARLVLGLAVAALLAVPVRLRYSALLSRTGLDYAALAVYQRSGFWLAGLTAFTAAFLPALLPPVGAVSAALVALSSLLVGGLQTRSES